MEMCLISFIFRQMQLKITAKCYYISPCIIKRLKLSCIVQNIEQLKLSNIFHETVKSHIYSIKNSACINPWREVFSREEYWSGCHALLQGIFVPRDQTQVLYISPPLAGVFFTTRTTWEVLINTSLPIKIILNLVIYLPQIKTYIHKITRTMTYFHKISSVQSLSHVQLFATL